MEPRRDETIREVNRYLDNLKGDGRKYYVSVKTFNEGVDTLISNKNIREVGELERSEYRPSGWTRLLDAVGATLENIWTSDQTLVAVVTDGQENDSRNYGLSQVRDLIDRKRSAGVQFVFLGDGPSAWRTGNRLGFNISVSTDWSDPRNSENIYKSLYTASNTMSTGGIISPRSFTTGSTSAVDTTPQEKK